MIQPPAPPLPPGDPGAPCMSGRSPGKAPRMFFFFSNRIGCLASLLISVIGTVILYLLFAR
jgi:hypothetical protein